MGYVTLSFIVLGIILGVWCWVGPGRQPAQIGPSWQFLALAAAALACGVAALVSALVWAV